MVTSKLKNAESTQSERWMNNAQSASLKPEIDVHQTTILTAQKTFAETKSCKTHIERGGMGGNNTHTIVKSLKHSRSVETAKLLNTTEGECDNPVSTYPEQSRSHRHWLAGAEGVGCEALVSSPTLYVKVQIPCKGGKDGPSNKTTGLKIWRSKLVNWTKKYTKVIWPLQCRSLL